MLHGVFNHGFFDHSEEFHAKCSNVPYNVQKKTSLKKTPYKNPFFNPHNKPINFQHPYFSGSRYLGCTQKLQSLTFAKLTHSTNRLHQLVLATFGANGHLVALQRREQKDNVQEFRGGGVTLQECNGRDNSWWHSHTQLEPTKVYWDHIKQISCLVRGDRLYNFLPWRKWSVWFQAFKIGFTNHDHLYLYGAGKLHFWPITSLLQLPWFVLIYSKGHLRIK